jgi:hypothetical protein
MPTIDNLSTIDTLAGGDQVPVYDKDAGTARKASMSQMLAFFAANFASPDVDTIISSPIDGFNQQLAASTKSIWLILTPAAGLASGTITLPPKATAYDGQMVFATSSQIISSLSVLGNGAAVSGAPPNLGAGGFFALRYNKLTDTWYAVSAANTDTFVDVVVTGSIVMPEGGPIIDDTGSPMLLLQRVASAVNYLVTTSAAAGQPAQLSAAGGSTDIDIRLTPKGGGSVTSARPISTSSTLVAGASVVAGTDIIAAGDLTIGGKASFGDDVSVTADLFVSGDILGGLITTFGYDVADLPAPASSEGKHAYVTDSNAALTAGIGAIVVGGGANIVPVFCDGTNWRIG